MIEFTINTFLCQFQQLNSNHKLRSSRYSLVDIANRYLLHTHVVFGLQ